MSCFKNGTKDIVKGLLNINLSLYLAWSDIRQRYRRSTLGPFWITISTGVMVACIGLIFGNLFKSPMSEFLPFLASGLIIWGFIANCLTEATTVFVNSEAIIKQLPLPIFTHVLRMVARNFYIFLHNLAILPVVYLCVHKDVGWSVLLFFPGISILIVNILWVSLFLGIICARYRDLSQIVVNILQVFFYITPIIWMPNLLPERTSIMVLEPNPLYHLIQIVRAPLLSQNPTVLNWFAPILLAIFGCLFTNFIFNKYKNRIAYWL